MSVWIRFSGCCNARVICFTEIYESVTIIGGYLMVCVSSYSLSVRVWGPCSSVEITYHYNKIVKWNVTKTVDKIVVEGILVFCRGSFCWIIWRDVTFGFQSIVTSNCLLLILLMCKICLSCNCFRNQQSSSSLRSVTVLYRKFYASVFTALVSSFVLHLYSWMATTSKLSALHPDVSCRSRPGLNNVRTL